MAYPEQMLKYEAIESDPIGPTGVAYPEQMLKYEAIESAPIGPGLLVPIGPNKNPRRSEGFGWG